MLIGKIVRYIKPKFYLTHKEHTYPKLILDIGVANNSYRECKQVFPNAKYIGLDIFPLNIGLEKEDEFILCNLETQDVASMINYQTVDLILVNHVLEHLGNGEDVFKTLCSLLSPGGYIYCEFPSIRTAMTRKTRHSYHFHDDPTHKRFYSLETLANIAMDSGCQVVSCGKVSTPVKDIFSIPRAIVDFVRGIGYGSNLLFLQRKIDHILCRKNVLASKSNQL